VCDDAPCPVPQEIRDDIREPGLRHWNRDYYAQSRKRFGMICWKRDYHATFLPHNLPPALETPCG